MQGRLSEDQDRARHFKLSPVRIKAIAYSMAVVWITNVLHTPITAQR